jgi:phosphoribosyl 1,2-cyclic phosphodiesterase
MTPLRPGPPHLDGAPGTHLTVQSLGSGSSGNAFLIEYGSRCLLLDCGVGIRTLTRALAERRRRLADLDAVLITHEHGDHIRTLPRLAGLDVPVVATAGTHRSLPIPDRQWVPIRNGGSATVGDLEVWAITVDHDAAEPCGYLIDTGSTRVSIFTDLGCWHDRLAEPVLASDLVVLEANHDEDMLRRGPYPIHLKRRVASSQGHLSNEECASSLATVLSRGSHAPAIWLAHLSHTNNTAVIARDTVHGVLQGADLGLEVIPLPRTSPGPIWRGHGTRNSTWSPAKGPVSIDQLAFDLAP